MLNKTSHLGAGSVLSGFQALRLSCDAKHTYHARIKNQTSHAPLLERFQHPK